MSCEIHLAFPLVTPSVHILHAGFPLWQQADATYPRLSRPVEPELSTALVRYNAGRPKRGIRCATFAATCRLVPNCQISDENAQFERAILQLKTRLDRNLQHLRAQLRLANKLLEFTAWHDNLRADLAARIAVAEVAEISIRKSLVAGR